MKPISAAVPSETNFFSHVTAASPATADKLYSEHWSEA